MIILVRKCRKLQRVDKNMFNSKKRNDKFDFISTSNIFDWAPVEKNVADITAIANQSLKKEKGSSMLLRLCFGGGHELADMLQQHDLQVVPGISMEELGKIETAPFFHNVDGGVLALQHKN